MSYLLPKRISEFATIDSDLDTPDKDNNNMKNKYYLPKRVAELDLQESDTEEDKNDRLNCAILNDSFVLSPSKELDLGITPCRNQEKTDENNQNAPNRPRTTIDVEADSGFHSKLSNMKIETTDKDASHSTRPFKSRTQLFATKSEEPSVFRNSLHKQEPPAKLLESSLHVPEVETPFKKAEKPIFVTPSVRPSYSFSVLTAKKSTNLPPQPMTCEKPPQAKILFTTPIARPPPGSLMESTPIDVRKPMQTIKKLSPIKEPSAEKANQRILTVNNTEYVIDKKIGSGGSSSVFLARGKNSGKEFAIKLVNLDGDQQVIDGYLNETKLLAKLQGNVNVVSLFDYCHLPEKSILYMVMEKGESDLHKILQGFRTHIPLYTLTKYWYQMLQAVNYIHLNGVIHSDLKPANFLMIEGRLKLIDFGIASNIALDSTSIIKFSQAGTFNYISPEALIDTSSGDSPSTHHQPKIRLSTKSDVWSLGCILYLLLYKKTPFSHIKVLHQKINALTNPHTVIEYPKLPSFYPPVLVEMVRLCLVYNPKERASVADLLKYPFEMIIPIDQ